MVAYIEESEHVEEQALHKVKVRRLRADMTHFEPQLVFCGSATQETEIERASVLLHTICKALCFGYQHVRLYCTATTV